MEIRAVRLASTSPNLSERIKIRSTQMRVVLGVGTFTTSGGSFCVGTKATKTAVSEAAQDATRNSMLIGATFTDMRISGSGGAKKSKRQNFVDSIFLLSRLIIDKFRRSVH